MQRLQAVDGRVTTSPGSLPSRGREARRTTWVYAPMRFPNPGERRVPSNTASALLSDDVERQKVMRLAVAAQASMTKVRTVEDLAPVLGMFVPFLIELLAGDGMKDRDTFKGPVFTGATLGYVIGMMENASGAAKSGRSEGHYRMAMELAEAELPEELKTMAYEYAKESGYYLARKGPISLDEVVAGASAYIDELRTTERAS